MASRFQNLLDFLRSVGTEIFIKIFKKTSVKVCKQEELYISLNEMLGWMNDKLESRLLGEISITLGMQMIPR